jgi:UDP-GlcNAc:undecaprenyl-phosphate GlcNAc-1-phosphate transferase
LGQALVLFLFSLVLVGLITPLVRKLAIRLDVVDHPSEAHKTHSAPVPYLGGLSIIIGVVVTTFVVIALSGNFRLLGLASAVLLPAIFMGIIGLIDDIKKLSPWPRFLVQNAVGLGIALVLVSTNTLGAPSGNQYLDVLVTVFWIVGITNSINFFDNVDGGASGSVAISSMFLFLLALQGGQHVIAALSIVLSGATAGFLMWNKAPARIYMGDAGALFLGVLIASLALRFNPNPIDRISSFAIPILLLAVPILDTTVAVLSRLKRRVSPFQGGRDHLSHRLMHNYFSKRTAVLFLWAISMLFGLFAILISLAPFHFERVITTLGLVLWLILLIKFLKMKLVDQVQYLTERES